jgi:hypothetical protein
VSTVPAFLHGLVDDAAVFPPGSAPLEAALAAHLDHRAAEYAALVGPFVVGDQALPALREALSPQEPPQEPHGLPVVVVVSGGAGALEPAARWAGASSGLRLQGLEVTVRESDAGALSPNTRRLLAAVDALAAAGDLDEEVAVHLEPPRLHGSEPPASWLGVLDEVAAAGHRLKLRTGGLEAGAFPGSAELATCIGAALDRELPFKCTAGLHRAVRHRDPHTGFQQHGFLNVLAATRTSLDGAGHAEVVAALEETDAAALLARTDEAGLAGARQWFTSFGSCSIAEPLEDLRALGLVRR